MFDHLVLQCNEVSPIAEPTTYTVGFLKQNVLQNKKDLPHCRTYSPVSVFESSSSSCGENSSFDLPIIPVKRARGRRRRLSSFSPLLSLPFISTEKLLNRVKRKQRKKDVCFLSGDINMNKSSSEESSAPRKCMHCEVTKTPQWREGPMGPKTLCNACGVRYRSGRLFPEYRPAVSPTFVASLHSNSHKKVLEMRNTAVQEALKDCSILGHGNRLG